MYKVTINWYENYCQIDEDSDFFSDLSDLFPIQDRDKAEVNNLIFNRLDNLPFNHYGLLCQQTKINHKFII